MARNSSSVIGGSGGGGCKVASNSSTSSHRSSYGSALASSRISAFVAGMVVPPLPAILLLERRLRQLGTRQRLRHLFRLSQRRPQRVSGQLLPGDAPAARRRPAVAAGDVARRRQRQPVAGVG